MEQWPAVIKVDSAAAISFQQATKRNTNLKGVYNLRDKRVQELPDDSNIVTEKVCTTLNLPDVLSKCLTATARTKPLAKLDRLVSGLGGGYVRHLGGNASVIKWFDSRQVYRATDCPIEGNIDLRIYVSECKL